MRDFSLEELEQAARLMRGYDLVALCAAGSGHSGGTLSMMEIVAALYLKVANHDPNNPEWRHRDRIIWSGGHKAPALYLGLAFAGYFPIEDVVTLRKLYSPFQGHPHRLKLPGVEVSSGSLGQGLSIAVGMALAGKLDHEEHTVFCIMGDGEQQEGNIWEAAMEASHYKLDNLVGIIDRNRLQIDGWVKDVMNVEPLDGALSQLRLGGHRDRRPRHDAGRRCACRKPRTFRRRQADGDHRQHREGQRRQLHGKRCRLARQGSQLRRDGESARRARAEEHDCYDALLKKANEYQAEVEATLAAKMPTFSRDYWWNSGDRMKVKMDRPAKASASR